DQRSGRDHITAHDDHHHLHGEGHQRPEVLTALDGEFGGALIERQTLLKYKADEKDDDDSKQREHKRIGKPALAPVSEREPETNQTFFLRCGLLRWLRWHERILFDME